MRHPAREAPPVIVTLDYSEGDPYGGGGYQWGAFLSKEEAGRVQNTIDLLTELEVSDVFYVSPASDPVQYANSVVLTTTQAHADGGRVCRGLH